MRVVTTERLHRIRTLGARLVAVAGLEGFAQRHLGGLRGRLRAKEQELREERRALHHHQEVMPEAGMDEQHGVAVPGTMPPTLLLLNDCRDQDNYGSQVLVDGLIEILTHAIPSYRLRTIPSHWVIDDRYGFGAFVNGGVNLRQPQAVWPEVADQFEVVADEWLNDRGGPGARAFLDRLQGSDVVVLNGEGSIYRRNASAVRELFLAWFAKTRLDIPTLFLNGMVHLTDVVPILPAMVRKTFPLFDGVAVRDPCSLRNLNEYVPGLEARMIPDSAFSLAADGSGRERRDNPLGARLTGVDYFTFDPGAMPSDHRFGDRSALFKLINELKRVVPQAVLIASAPSDLYLERLAEETDSIFVRSLSHHSALMGLFSNAQFQVTGRYHNVILGALVGCPAIALASTSHKVHGVCELLEDGGAPYDGTALDRAMGAIAEHAARYLDDRARLRARLVATAARLGEASMEMGEMVKAVLPQPAAASTA